MYVCVCHGVTDRDIKKAVDGGVSTVEGLGQSLNVGTCCGRCTDCAQEILNETLPEAGSISIPCHLAA